MASISTVVTMGYGSFGSVNLLPTIGYGIQASVVESTLNINTKGGRGDNVSKAGRSDVSKGGDDDDINKAGGIG